MKRSISGWQCFPVQNATGTTVRGIVSDCCERRICAAFAVGGGRRSAKNGRVAEIPPVMSGISASIGGRWKGKNALAPAQQIAGVTVGDVGVAKDWAVVAVRPRNFFSTPHLTARICVMLPPSFSPWCWVLCLNRVLFRWLGAEIAGCD